MRSTTLHQPTPHISDPGPARPPTPPETPQPDLPPGVPSPVPERPGIPSPLPEQVPEPGPVNVPPPPVPPEIPPATPGARSDPMLWRMRNPAQKALWISLSLSTSMRTRRSQIRGENTRLARRLMRAPPSSIRKSATGNLIHVFRIVGLRLPRRRCAASLVQGQECQLKSRASTSAKKICHNQIFRNESAQCGPQASLGDRCAGGA